MTTLLLVFVTLRVIAAAVSVEVSGEDIPAQVSFTQQVLGTGCCTLGTDPGAAGPGDGVVPALAFSWPVPFFCRRPA